MKWQELFAPGGDESDPTLILVDGVLLEPKSRKEALSLSILKWEAMVELGLAEDGGWPTCGMCVLYTCQSTACYSMCGVNCLVDDSPFLTWQDEPTIDNARAMLYQLKTMYLEEFEDAESTD